MWYQSDSYLIFLVGVGDSKLNGDGDLVGGRGCFFFFCS
jgi:hypothetical protein